MSAWDRAGMRGERVERSGTRRAASSLRRVTRLYLGTTTGVLVLRRRDAAREQERQRARGESHHGLSYLGKTTR